MREEGDPEIPGLLRSEVAGGMSQAGFDRYRLDRTSFARRASTSFVNPENAAVIAAFCQPGDITSTPSRPSPPGRPYADKPNLPPSTKKATRIHGARSASRAKALDK